MERPVDEVLFAVVDVETSGLSPRRDHVLQVGVVVVDGRGTVHDRWSSLLAPRHKWWFRVGPTQVHGIRRRDLRGAPPGAAVLRELASRIGEARFVAHNAPFDIAFLQKAARRHGVAVPIREPLCTLRLSRALDPDRALSHRLGDVCARYGIELERPHDALADADAAAAALPHLLRAHGITDAAQLPAPLQMPLAS